MLPLFVAAVLVSTYNAERTATTSFRGGWSIESSGLTLLQTDARQHVSTSATLNNGDSVSHFAAVDSKAGLEEAKVRRTLQGRSGRERKDIPGRTKLGPDSKNWDRAAREPVQKQMVNLDTAVKEKHKKELQESPLDLEGVATPLHGVRPIIPSPNVARFAGSTHFRVPYAAVAKVTRLAKLVLYITHRNSSTPDALLGGTNQRIRDHIAARSMYLRLTKNQTVTAPEVAHLVEMAAQSQSAESAARNDVLVTASHVAMLVGGFRGEDYGANYNFDPATAKRWQTFQGDILTETEARPWRYGRVKYCLSPDISLRIKDLFEKAIAHYTQVMPCLKFDDVGVASGNSNSSREAQKCATSPAVFVTSRNDLGCFAHRGMIEGKDYAQLLQLSDPGCASIGTVMHELGHALGLGHERLASSTSVRHNMVKHGRGQNFEVDTRPGGLVSSNSLSLMHMDPYAFSTDPRRPTLEGPEFDLMGQRIGLASSDVKQLVRLYSLEGCEESALDGLGCINNPTYDGVCPSQSKRLPWCSKTALSNCCACGGGVSLQCYKGKYFVCPRVLSYTFLTALRVAFVTVICFGGLACSSCIVAAYLTARSRALRQRFADECVKKTYDLSDGDDNYSKDPVEKDEDEDIQAAYGALGPNPLPRPRAPTPEPAPKSARSLFKSGYFGWSTPASTPVAGRQAPASDGTGAAQERSQPSRLTAEAYGEFTPYALGISTGRPAANSADGAEAVPPLVGAEPAPSS